MQQQPHFVSPSSMDPIINAGAQHWGPARPHMCMHQTFLHCCIDAMVKMYAVWLQG